MRAIISKAIMVPVVLLLLILSGCGNDSGTAINDPSSAAVAGDVATATNEKILYAQTTVFGSFDTIYTVPKSGTLTVNQTFNGFYNGALGNLKITNSTGADLPPPPPPVCTGKPGKVKDCLEKYNDKVLKPYYKKLALNPTSIEVLINDQVVVAAGSIPRTQGVTNVAVAINITNTLQVNLSGPKGSYIRVEISSENTPPLQNPTADFTYSPTSGTVPLDVAFDASSSLSPNGSIASYNWDFGDGTTDNTMNPLHTYISAGTYAVTLTVIDSAGKSATKTSSITVSDLQLPVASFTYSVDTTSGLIIISVDGSSSSSTNGAIVAYEWHWGDRENSPIMLTPLASHTYFAPGTYSVSLLIYDSAGYSGVITQTITVP